MGVAGGENTVRLREAWVLFDRDAQLRHSLIEALGVEM
jgi:hypothetical protein